MLVFVVYNIISAAEVNPPPLSAGAVIRARLREYVEAVALRACQYSRRRRCKIGGVGEALFVYSNNTI